MNDKILQKKQQILNWLLALEDPGAIIKIDDLRKDIELQQMMSEPQTELGVNKDFEEEFAKGLSLEESRLRTKEFIEKLPWKN